MNFEYRSYPNNVYFGNGKIALLKDLLTGYRKVIVFAEQRMDRYVKNLVASLGQDRIVHFSDIVQHVPESVVKEAHELLKRVNPEVLVSIGGGSSVGLAKALALETRLPIFAVPSTYAGSEQTTIWGLTTAAGKTTGRADWILPRVVIYDPELTITMPKLLAVTSAMNAMAHLVEAVYSPSGNPITTRNSFLGIRELKDGLDRLAQSPGLTPEANEKLLFGAYLGGKSLCEVSMSLHHKAAHVLGGSFGMDHARVHTVLLPYVVAYQWPSLTEELREALANVFENEDVPAVLKQLASSAGASTDLQSIGFVKGDIPDAVELIVAKPYPNPVPVTREGVRDMLIKAWEGRLEGV